MCYIREVYHSTKDCVGDCDDISQLREGKNMLLFIRPSRDEAVLCDWVWRATIGGRESTQVSAQ